MFVVRSGWCDIGRAVAISGPSVPTWPMAETKREEVSHDVRIAVHCDWSKCTAACVYRVYASKQSLM